MRKQEEKPSRDLTASVTNRKMYKSTFPLVCFQPVLLKAFYIFPLLFSIYYLQENLQISLTSP